MRHVDAARIQEVVLETRRRILGDQHLDTLWVMHTLAMTYQEQGRRVDVVRIQEEMQRKNRRAANVLNEELNKRSSLI